jgi:hypothetical protein
MNLPIEKKKKDFTALEKSLTLPKRQITITLLFQETIHHEHT